MARDLLPLPLVSVKETSETPFEKSRAQEILCRRGGVAKIPYRASGSDVRLNPRENCLICWLARFRW